MKNKSFQTICSSISSNISICG